MNDAPANLFGLTSDELAALAAQRVARGAGLARRIHRHAFRTGQLDPAAFGGGAAAVAAWTAAVRVRLPEVIACQEDADEADEHHRAGKLILGLEDGARIECVRVPMGRGRVHLCVSCQTGCRQGCAFCQTASLGAGRNLSSHEITGQVMAARLVAGWPVRHVMFMGMGEPCENLDHVIQAMRVLADRYALGLGQERFTVCTSGHVDGIRRLAALNWKHLNLAISLNAATDALRDRLMPINRRWPLSALQEALAAYRPRPAYVLAVNYCLLPGLNDRREDAAAIARFLAPLGKAIVHLIPYNPGERPLTPAPAAADIERFVGWLRDEGVAVRARVPKGRSIMAACGQLGRK